MRRTSVSEKNEKIVFSAKLSGPGGKAVIHDETKLYLKESMASSMNFKCAFETTATTDAQDITVSVTSLGEQEIEQSGLKWENVQMKFYSDSRFESEVQS